MPPTTAELVQDESLGHLLRHLEVPLEGLATPSRTARSVLADVLRGNPEGHVDDAKLIASELIGNATLHAEGAVLMRVEVYEFGTALGVIDHGHDTGAIPLHPCNSSVTRDAVAQTGRGLFLVHSLAAKLTVQRAEPGKIVIAVLPTGLGS
ncbi:ATP-binding protein (plasmid) [Streptomyces sp. NBC_01281]|uniref:ATP-binding protein n=1 Tax=Streptomyces sp. NBC_01281 TaxID=2903811 RepID=UPI002E121196|nr:ATP-binding protein [Streptomyces sp. NBC_01281]